ncbi:histidine kinase [Psychroserpens burtonensis]|uniref:Histidine kinase n=1 Tax=Psychroserpens burtonensis TaxID=49278 RepID=A0A5C7B4P2_9FLAO|nr:histidine kinase [Psychroserpens burtonensis]TXE15418.1 histidine kinase [Psychroserpens burtonensis]
MKKLLKFLQLDTYFILFIFLVSYVIVVKNRISVGQKFDVVFLPDGPIAQFLEAFIIFIFIKIIISYMRKKNVQKVFSLKGYLKYFGIAFIVYICASNIQGIIIATIFDTVSKNFNHQTLMIDNIGKIVEFILFGSLYLAHLYSKENNTYRLEMNAYDKALASSKIQQLKAQLNPHFLFNNLNTLDQLIEEDKDKASNFLHHFSELYRYSLITSEKKLVSLKEEIQFTKSYFKLMEEKYLGCYSLEINQNNKTPEIRVPPFCLQVLIENAIEHNLGVIKNPVHITISINENIQVTNNKIKKQHIKKTSGRALKNLSTQFTLLGSTDIKIEENDMQFKVILPFINKHTDV